MLLIGTLIAVCMLSVSALAAPAKVSGVKVSVGETTCNVTWNKASSCSGYYIYVYNVPKKQMRTVKVSSARTTSMKIKNLSRVTQYRVAVAAFKGNSIGKRSDAVSFKTKILKPGKVKITVKSETASKTRFVWTKGSHTDYYEIWRKSAGKNKKSSRIKSNVVNRSYETKKLKAGKTYTFKVRGVRVYNGKTYYGPFTSATVMPYSKSSDKKLAAQVNTNYAYNGGSNPGASYSKAQLEAYVNYTNGGKPYSSANHYLVWINTNNYHVYIFTNKNRTSGRWTLLYGTPCIIGAPGNNTPPGIYTLHGGMVYCDYGSSHCEYVSFFIDTIAIHSLLYPSQADYLPSGYMGSHGCVRVMRQYCKFIYENCQGSTVIVR